MEVADRSARPPQTTFPRSAPRSAAPSSTTPVRLALPDADRRQRLPEFFALFTRAFLRHHQSYTTAGDVVAAALWAPPGGVPVGGEDAEELGRRIKELAGPDAPRFLGVDKLFDDHHPHGSYWYLQFLGVEPAWQGQGIGSALMAPVLERCDREGARAYLDATSERNKRLYERHGFQAQDPFAPPRGPPIWPM